MKEKTITTNTFGNKIKEILRKNGYNYRVRIFPKQDKILKYEKVIIYAGRNIEVSNSKRSKRLIAWKNIKGEWEGDLETLKQFCDKNSNGEYIGSSLYVMDYHDKTEPVKHQLFSDLWEEDEKEFGGQEQKLLKKMEDWKFQEMIRAKIDNCEFDDK